MSPEAPRPAVAPAPTHAAPRRWIGVLAALAFALALQGARPLWEPDEGRYVDVALEMIRSGDWWTPRLHHEVPHYSKPPLVYWTIAAAIELLGHDEAAVRLPNSLAFFATILVVGALARRLAPGTGITAPLVYGTSLLPFVAANVVTTDTLLTCFAALGVWGYVELAFGDLWPRAARLLLWGGFGLAFLTKGPPALLPLAAVLAFAATRRGAWRGPRRLVSSGALAVFALLAFGWFLHEIVRRPDLLPYLLGAEVVSRIGSPEFHRNDSWSGLARAYLPVIVVGMMPWLPLALARARRRRRAGASGAPAAPERSFLWLWLLLPLAVFLLSQSRMPLYLLPLAVPAALLLARSLGTVGLTTRDRAAIVAWILVLFLIKTIGAEWRIHRDGRAFATELIGQVPFPPAEVLFVEARPYYTVSFYTGAEVEEIDLPAIELRPREPSYRPIAETLVHELTDAEGARVYLASVKAEPAFRAELARLGATTRRIGQAGKFGIFLVPEPRGRDPQAAGAVQNVPHDRD